MFFLFSLLVEDDIFMFRDHMYLSIYAMFFAYFSRYKVFSTRSLKFLGFFDVNLHTAQVEAFCAPLLFPRTCEDNESDQHRIGLEPLVIADPSSLRQEVGSAHMITSTVTTFD